MPTIAESIKKHRQERDMRQCDFAKKLGVNQCVVSFWESGRCEPSLFYAICIADVFGITLDELVGRSRQSIANIKPVLLEIENTYGDTLMRCEIDVIQNKIRVQNGSVADVDFVTDNVFDSDTRIRLQQDSEDGCDFSVATHEYDI